MNFVTYALGLADMGFHVFPLRPNDKKPAIKSFPDIATVDGGQIAKWWRRDAERNVGISTSKFGKDGEAAAALIVIDVDVKGEANGDQTLAELEAGGCALPNTYTQYTPTGGRHIVYRAPNAVVQGAHVLGPGLDIRSSGGYIVGWGSQLEGKSYTHNNLWTVADAPAWLLQRLPVARKSDRKSVDVSDAATLVDQRRAKKQAIEYLARQTAVSEGERNHAGFKVAAHLVELGVSKSSIAPLLIEWWNCEPMLEQEELDKLVNSAFDNSQNAPGSASIEAQFSGTKKRVQSKPLSITNEQPEILDTESKVEQTPTRWEEQYNAEFAFAVIGGSGHILREHQSYEGKAQLDHLTVETFYKLKASDIQIIETKKGSKEISRASMWMKSELRRTYDGICFAPGKSVSKRFYNLWRGFSVEPASHSEHSSVQAFLEHAEKNVCRGDVKSVRYLIGFFAHLIQRPYEKPLVALVFRGKKGTGKNALVDRVGHLLGRHYTVADDKRYLLGNFNAHLEDNLFFVLDEAAPWSGDKAAEGALKGLITANRRRIERKGQDSYEVANYCRVAIISNEDWIVPASQDERRYAVFNVGDGRAQDRAFFRDMRVGMEDGGYPHLLRFLLDYDLTGFDINAAPGTEGLREQKEMSLEPIHQWWLKCLIEGRLVCSDFSSVWPDKGVEKERMRSAYRRFHEDRRLKRALPSDGEFGRRLKEVVPTLPAGAKVSVGNKLYAYAYVLPDLATARKQWDKFMGFERKDWDNE